MSLAAKLLSASGGAVDKLWVDDVFAAHTYVGNGGTQTINNGIDLAGKSGMVWVKVRNASIDHVLSNTANGASKGQFSSGTASLNNFAPYGVSSFNSNGFTVTDTADGGFRHNGSNGGLYSGNGTYASWTFRKAKKFFDVVTYTGNGVAGRQIPHELGIAPGMIVFKRTDSAGDWFVYHRALTWPDDQYLKLNTTAGALNGSPYIVAAVSSASVTFGSSSSTLTNINGATYVAYLFAHDASADGIVQCGSFTTDASGNATVNHGWSAGVKFAAIKASSTTGDWEMYDTARTAAWSGSDARLRANLSNAEDSVSRLSASGTSVSFSGLSASATYIYLFIVAPT